MQELPMDEGARSGRIGEPVRRKEDQRLLTGKGCFSDDVDLPCHAHAFFIRSPHAHARIRSIDVIAALAMPGVLAVLTGNELLADGLNPLPHLPLSLHPAEIRLPNRDGSAMFMAPPPCPRHRQGPFRGRGAGSGDR